MSIVVVLDTQYGINYNSNKFFTAIRLQMKCNFLLQVCCFLKLNFKC